MKIKTNTFQLALAGMLIAIGIVIPMFSPIKIIIEPASFTLASHVPVFIAMFISPMMAAAVALPSKISARHWASRPSNQGVASRPML